MKKYTCQWIGLGLFCVATTMSLARAPAPQPFSLLVVPEQMNKVQVGVDLTHRRPVALVIYRVSARTGELVLHGWDDGRWVHIPLADYQTGQFLLRQPDRIILMEGAGDLPMDLVLASGWGPRVMSVVATQPADFINAVGQLFEFSSSEWRWFASRYGLEIEQVRDDRAEVSWYDQMSEARRQPPRRQVEEPAPVPVAPLPDPTLEIEERGDHLRVIEQPPRQPKDSETEVPDAPPQRDPVAPEPEASPVAPLPDVEWEDELEFVK